MTQITEDMLTDWYSAESSPVREGVYELLNTSTGRTFYARRIEKLMYGKFVNVHLTGWSNGYSTPEEAAEATTFGVVQDRWPWRGLTEEGLFRVQWPWPHKRVK